MRLLAALLITILALPAQDLPCSALPIPSAGNYPGDTSSLTASGINVGCTIGGTTTKDAWYLMVPDGSGVVGINTCSVATNFDTAIAVYTGPDCNTLSEQHCNDDDFSCTAAFGASSLSFPVVSGTNYWIRITGYSGENGNYRLAVAADPGVIGLSATTALGVNGDGFSWPSCSAIIAPTGSSFLVIEVQSPIPNQPIILAASVSCAPGPGIGVMNTFDLDYPSLMWIADGSTFQLQGVSSFWNSIAHTDAVGVFSLGARVTLSVGPFLSFQSAVIDPAAPLGIDLTQALEVVGM